MKRNCRGREFDPVEAEVQGVVFRVHDIHRRLQQTTDEKVFLDVTDWTRLQAKGYLDADFPGTSRLAKHRLTNGLARHLVIIFLLKVQTMPGN